MLQNHRTTRVGLGALITTLTFFPLALQAGDDDPAVTAQPRLVEWWFQRHAEKIGEMNKRDIDLLMVGDSITHNFEGIGARVWEKYFEPRNAINLGFGGDRTNHVLWRLEHLPKLKKPPRAAVVLIGTNNVCWGSDEPVQAARGVQAVAKKLSALYPDMKTIVLAVFPRRRQADHPHRKEIDELNSYLPALLEDIENVSLLDIGQKFLDEKGHLSEQMMPDTTHPSEKGHEIWAETLDPVLDQLLGARRYRVGLSMYSLRQLFSEGKLDPLDYPKFAKETFGITDIDVWDGGFPKERRDDPEFYKELKKRADAVGSNIFLVMAGVISAKGKNADEHAAEAKRFYAPVEHAVLLGARYVRVFLGAPNDDRDQAIDRSVQVLKPLADFAATKDVTIVIEPGGSKWSTQARFLVAVAEKLDHSACRLMPDFGKLPHGEVYEGTVAMMPHSNVVSAKSHDFDADGNESRFDYARLMSSVKAADFTGIVAIEYEGSELSPVDGVKATQTLLMRHRQ